MSLSFTKNSQNDKEIAYLIDDGSAVDCVYYIDEDNLTEDEEQLKRVRLNSEIESFLPVITSFEDNKQVDRVYICGETGSGKSTFISIYAKLFHLKYPKSKIYLFSSKKEDETLDKLKYIERINVDDSVINDPYSVKDISARSKTSLVIFDDIQDYPNKKINQEIARFRDELMRNGRGNGVYTMFVHHDPCDYKATKSMIFEANKIVIFPKRSGEGAYNYLLEKKLHLNKKYIDSVNNLKSDWVLINKANPKYILSNKYILLT